MDLVPPASPRAEQDRALIISARNGEAHAFETLMKKYRQNVYFMLLKMIRHPDDAEDLTQEAFVKAFARINDFDAKYSFATWLFRIATNNCIDFMRKKKLQTLSLDQPIGSEEGFMGFINIRDNDLDPNAQMLSDQRKAYIHIAVNKLPPRYKEIIEMRYFQELSYNEITEELKIPIGTVKAKLHQAKELLNEILNQMEGTI